MAAATPWPFSVCVSALLSAGKHATHSPHPTPCYPLPPCSYEDNLQTVRTCQLPALEQLPLNLRRLLTHSLRIRPQQPQMQSLTGAPVTEAAAAVASMGAAAAATGMAAAAGSNFSSSPRTVATAAARGGLQARQRSGSHLLAQPPPMQQQPAPARSEKPLVPRRSAIWLGGQGGVDPDIVQPLLHSDGGDACSECESVASGNGGGPGMQQGAATVARAAGGDDMV